MDLIFAGVGLLLLVGAGDILVRGAVSLSLRLGIPALIVSLTIVAFGTSAPELLIAIEAALSGVPALALGNVVGSNVANVLLVLGVPALIAGLDPGDCDSRESYLQMAAVTAIFIVLLFAGPLVYWHGTILLVLLAAMLARAAVGAMRAQSDAVDDFDPDVARSTPIWRAVLFLAGGIIGLPIGADLLVDSARDIARDFGVSDEVIGLTLVAVGTSLPELATTVMAALRRQADVALGNVIGSNMFNILAIMGVASFFGPLHVPRQLLETDVWVMAAAGALLAPFVFFGWKLTRTVGVAFLGAYTVYMVSLF